MKRLALLSLVAGALLLTASAGRVQGPPGVEVRVVKYDGLKEAVVKNRGKVVLIDFWANY